MSWFKQSRKPVLLPSIGDVVAPHGGGQAVTIEEVRGYAIVYRTPDGRKMMRSQRGFCKNYAIGTTPRASGDSKPDQLRQEKPTAAAHN